jgi:hypothetical protein
MLCVMDPEDLQTALGAIVLEASYLERVLRAAFTVLTGSKYAPVVDAHLSTHNLIETCEHIADVHTDLSSDDRLQLKTAIRSCAGVNPRRNRAIHDAWADRPGAILALPAGQRPAKTLPELHQLAEDLGQAADELAAAVTAAFGAAALGLEDQLRQELGRDVGADLGS